jgi:hypothetical protein
MNSHPVSMLLPLAAMARYLGVPPRWLRGQAEAGMLPHVKCDSALLFDPELVEKLLLERARVLPVPPLPDEEGGAPGAA